MRTFAKIDAPAEPPAHTGESHPDDGPQRTVYVVDDDHFARSSVRMMLEGTDWSVEEFSDCESFLATFDPHVAACLVVDVHLPGMGGLDLIEQLVARPSPIPVVVISGSSGIGEAVRSMKAGACDFLEKPVQADRLLAGIAEAFRRSDDAQAVTSMHRTARDHIAHLTPRQREIMRLVLAGHPSKNIAADLGISQRTVENHRASIMHKTGARSLPALAKLALSSVWRPDERVGGH